MPPCLRHGITPEVSMESKQQPAVSFTQEQLEKLMSDLSGKIATEAAAKALEGFADGLETADATVSHQFLRPIVESTLREVSKKARDTAQMIRATRIA